jgi:protein-S-isoprenylcysteine O-methyltransferase Ste14
MVMALFAFTFVCELLACACVAYSIIAPKRSLWPPPRLHCWQSYLMWTLFLGSAIGVVLSGLFDWGGSEWAWWVRYAAGLPLWLVGQGISLWSVLALGIKPTFGRDDQLVLQGPYAHSRNPQYLGYSLGLIGWGLICGSWWTLAIALMGMPAFHLASRSEENYLMRVYGAEYETYLREAPRCISIVSFISKNRDHTDIV